MKINARAFTLDACLPKWKRFRNGCCKLVIRDHMGTIVKMYSCTIRNLTVVGNEL